MGISLSLDEPTCTSVTENGMAWRWEGGCEYTGILSNDFYKHNWSVIEEMMIMENGFVEDQEN